MTNDCRPEQQCQICRGWLQINLKETPHLRIAATYRGLVMKLIVMNELMGVILDSLALMLCFSWQRSKHGDFGFRSDGCPGIDVRSHADQRLPRGHRSNRLLWKLMWPFPRLHAALAAQAASLTTCRPDAAEGTSTCLHPKILNTQQLLNQVVGFKTRSANLKIIDQSLNCALKEKTTFLSLISIGRTCCFCFKGL